jgi:hypothetical protein
MHDATLQRWSSDFCSFDHGAGTSFVLGCHDLECHLCLNDTVLEEQGASSRLGEHVVDQIGWNLGTSFQLNGWEVGLCSSASVPVYRVDGRLHSVASTVLPHLGAGPWTGDLSLGASAPAPGVPTLLPCLPYSTVQGPDNRVQEAVYPKYTTPSVWK